MISKKDLSGFTLIELAIVITIVGVLTVPALYAYGKKTEAEKRAETKERMRDVRKAMAQYYAIHAKYPCPGPAVMPNQDYDFYLDCWLDGQDLVKAGNRGVKIFKDQGRTIIEGALPYRHLNIPEYMAKDAWGNFFTYAVSINATLPDFMPGENNIGVMDRSGQSLTVPENAALWILLSHGRDGAGSYNGQTTERIMVDKSHADSQNADSDGSYTMAPFSEAQNENFFDDLLYYQTWAEYPEGSGQVYCVLPGSSDPIRPTLVQNGATVRNCRNSESDCSFSVCKDGEYVPVITNIIDVK
jgi:prepilin-type N-terminal cleavage/methylation domain-containing protein